eukprot:Pgem_evm2s20126
MSKYKNDSNNEHCDDHIENETSCSNYVKGNKNYYTEQYQEYNAHNHSDVDYNDNSNNTNCDLTSLKKRSASFSHIPHYNSHYNTYRSSTENNDAEYQSKQTCDIYKQYTSIYESRYPETENAIITKRHHSLSTSSINDVINEDSHSHSDLLIRNKSDTIINPVIDGFDRNTVYHRKSSLTEYPYNGSRTEELRKYEHSINHKNQQHQQNQQDPGSNVHCYNYKPPPQPVPVPLPIPIPPSQPHSQQPPSPKPPQSPQSPQSPPPPPPPPPQQPSQPPPLQQLNYQSQQQQQQHLRQLQHLQQQQQQAQVPPQPQPSVRQTQQQQRQTPYQLPQQQSYQRQQQYE